MGIQLQYVEMLPYETTPLKDIQHWCDAFPLFDTVVDVVNFPASKASTLAPFDLKSVEVSEKTEFLMALSVMITSTVDLRVMFDETRVDATAAKAVLDSVDSLLQWLLDAGHCGLPLGAALEYARTLIPVGWGTIVPLSSQQHMVLQSGSNNPVCALLSVQQRPDVAMLTQALQIVAERHQVMCAQLLLEYKKPKMQVVAPSSIAWHVEESTQQERQALEAACKSLSAARDESSETADDGTPMAVICEVFKQALNISTVHPDSGHQHWG